jgi:signal transduction histidine kinase
VTAQLDLSRHLRAARRALLYLVAGVAEGLLNLVLVGGGLLLGLLLSPVWVGLPLLAGTGRLALRLAERERRQANRLLDAHLPPVPVPPGKRKLSWRRLMEESEGAAFWRVVGMLLLRLPTALAGLVFAGAPALLALILAGLGVSGLAGDPGRYVGPWALNALTGLLLCLLALPAAVVAIAALEGAGAGLRALALRLLRSRMPEGGPVRELLAERLGDRSLNIAYWLPDREIFVDDRGRPVQLPEPGSGRTWTAVDHEGARVAAIVHDAELDATPELVTAAASAAALAIDNERLKAELRARVEELRVSRLRIVEAADDARRRIERDLHDGAQQQLVSLALDLRMLKARLGDSGLATTVDTLGEKLADALAELRELARGIHPSILSERGIGAAVEALVARAPLNVSLQVDLDERLPAPVEAAVYFVIAEGLTNVVRYAETRNAAVQVSRLGGEAQVVVTDDGVGGATFAAGTGLRGLADRLAVLDGHLALQSPLGKGTRLEARVPLMPGSLVAEAAAPPARPVELPDAFPGEEPPVTRPATPATAGRPGAAPPPPRSAPPKAGS